MFSLLILEVIRIRIVFCSVDSLSMAISARFRRREVCHKSGTDSEKGGISSLAPRNLSGINLGTTPRRHHTRGSKNPGLKLHRSKRGMTITRRRFWLLSLSCNFSVPKYLMDSSRSFKLSCMDGQVDYPGVQGNVGQTLSCPSEKDSEPSRIEPC